MRLGSVVTHGERTGAQKGENCELNHFSGMNKQRFNLYAKEIESEIHLQS